MVSGWRIVKRRRADTAFDGEGSRLHGGRWNSPGVPVVYVAETRALAALELLAGLGSLPALSAYVLIETRFEEALVETLETGNLPAGWRASPPPAETQALGDVWVREARTAVLRVPSVLVPGEFNYLLNPAHPEFTTIEVGEPVPFELDSRLGR